MSTPSSKLTPAQQDSLAKASQEAEGKPYLQQLAILALALVGDKDNGGGDKAAEDIDMPDRDHDADPNLTVLQTTALAEAPLSAPGFQPTYCYPPIPNRPYSYPPPPGPEPAYSYPPPPDMFSESKAYYPNHGGIATRCPLHGINENDGMSQYYAPADECDLPAFEGPRKFRNMPIPIITISPPSSDIDCDSDNSMDITEAPRPKSREPISIVIHFSDGTSHTYPPSILAGIQAGKL